MNTSANPSDESVEAANQLGNIMLNKMPEKMNEWLDKHTEEAMQNIPPQAEQVRRMKAFQRMPDGSLYTSPTGDGAQTKLKGAEAQKLRELWCTGLDLRPPFNMNPFQVALFTGNVKIVSDVLEAVSGLREQGAPTPPGVAKRVSLLRLGPLHIAIQGLRALPRVLQRGERKEDFEKLHWETIKAVVKYMPETVHERDCAGKTSLMMCTELGGSERMLEAVRLFVEAGADINARDRFGSNAIFAPIMRADTRMAELLASLEIDLDGCDNDGISPVSLCTFQPGVMAAIQRATKKKNMVGLEESKSCSNCGKSDAAKLSRCSNCLTSRYCSRECQVKGWPSHKTLCKAANTPTVKLAPMEVVFNHAQQRVIRGSRKNTSKPLAKGTKLVVKIQVVTTMPMSAPMMLYNEERSVSGMINPDQPGFAIIAQTIVSKGILGAKGYFNAKIEGDKELRIAADTLVAGHF